MSDANTNNAPTSQAIISNQIPVAGDGSGNSTTATASNATPASQQQQQQSFPTSTMADSSTSIIPPNPTSSNTGTSVNVTGVTDGTSIPSSSAAAALTAIAPRVVDTSTATDSTAVAATATTSTTIPTGNVASTTTTSAAAPSRTVPILKKAKKRVKDTSIGKETNDSGNPVKKKVRKVNRNSAGGSGPGTGRASLSAGGNVGSSTSGPNSGITNHHNHPNMPSIHHNGLIVHDGLSPAQQAAQEQMRRALEEDRYSLVGSIIDNNNDSDTYDDDATDDGDHPYTNYTYNYRGSAVRLDKAAMIQAARKYILLEQRLQQQQQNATGAALKANGTLEHHNYGDDDDDDDDDDDMDGMEYDIDGDGTHPADGGTSTRRGGVAGGNNSTNQYKISGNNGNKKKKRKDELSQLNEDVKLQNQQPMSSKDPLSLDPDDDIDRDGGSIFGATTGQSNSTWVECDKCKKWRRLRGVVDEKKLPSKWYCSMNKNDPERARCSAPEEEYETSHTPESAADSRTRKHLRVWVRRLQCNEAYESRQPTLTRGKKRNAVSASSTNPYEWVRCCNPSCGKWRALLRIMDAKGNVVDRTTDGEWYCVMNNWDEKMASCAAPQENIPAVGCPPWVMQDGK